MPQKDPHVVLGVEQDASADEIKAAWRRLAREHHPDLTGDDPSASTRATRRMADINGAYAALTRVDNSGRWRGDRDRARGTGQPPRPRADERRSRAAGGPGSTASDGNGAGGHAGGARRAGRSDGEASSAARAAGSSASRSTRPVTGRLDLSSTFTPRNQTTTPPGTRIPLTGQPPLRWSRRAPELRASEPSGPLRRDRVPDHRAPQPPSLDEALDVELGFGKFHGHTLGEVASFEPSYIDWLAATIGRDPLVSQSARVIRDELDRRGIDRPHRPLRPGWRSNPFG